MVGAITYYRKVDLPVDQWLVRRPQEIGVMYIVVAPGHAGGPGFADAIMRRGQTGRRAANHGYLPPEHYTRSSPRMA